MHGPALRRVRFVDGGGHNGIGAFSEDGRPALYERKAPLPATFLCRGLTRHRAFGRHLRPGPGNDLRCDDRISGTGHAAGQGGDLLRLSILGSDHEHDEVDLLIRRADANRLLLHAPEAETPRGVARVERFGVEVDLFGPLYDGLIAALDRSDGTEVLLSLRLDGVTGVVAEWDVPPDAPRLVKIFVGAADIRRPSHLPTGMGLFDGVLPGDFSIEVRQALSAGQT